MGSAQSRCSSKGLRSGLQQDLGWWPLLQIIAPASWKAKGLPDLQSWGWGGEIVEELSLRLDGRHHRIARSETAAAGGDRGGK